MDPQQWVLQHNEPPKSPPTMGGHRYTPHLMYTHTYTYINVDELSLSQASVIHCTVRIWDTLSGKGVAVLVFGSII